MNKLKYISLAIAFFLIGGFIVGVVMVKAPVQDQKVSGNVDTDFINGNFTATSVSVSSTPKIILAAKEDRQVAYICLDSALASFPLYLGLTSTSTSNIATSTGMMLISRASTTTSAGENCFTIGDNFKYPGIVYGITATATPQNVTILEK